MYKAKYNQSDITLFKQWQEENKKQTIAFILTFITQKVEELLNTHDIKAVKINDKLYNAEDFINNFEIEYSTEIKNKVLNDLKNKAKKAQVKQEKYLEKNNIDDNIKKYLDLFLEKEHNTWDDYHNDLSNITDFLGIAKHKKIEQSSSNINNSQIKKYTYLKDSKYYKFVNNETMIMIKKTIEFIKAIENDYFTLLKNHMKKPLIFTQENLEVKKVDFYGSMNIYIEKMQLENTMPNDENKVKINTSNRLKI